MQTNRWSVHELTRMALLAALLCASAYLAFPIPITLVVVTAQTFVLNLTALLLNRRQTAVTVGLWILLGAVGVPVYSGGRGGLGALFGPTGGFIFGFLIAAWLIAWLKGEHPTPARAMGLVLLGIPIIDLLGAVWYGVYAQIPLGTALLTTALPFLPGDIIKGVGAVVVWIPLRKALKHLAPVATTD